MVDSCSVHHNQHQEPEREEKREREKEGRKGRQGEGEGERKREWKTGSCSEEQVHKRIQGHNAILRDRPQ